MCLYPKIIKNRKYTKNKKNGGNIPQVKDKRVLYVPVACGNCMECKKQKGRQWQVRLNEEIRENKTGKFVTLTFDEEHLKELKNEIKSLDGYDLENEVATLAVRRFLERWRKKFGKSVRHWLVTELGQTNTERVHLHGVIFTRESAETIEERWHYGHVWIGEYVNEKTINYIVKYISKTDKLHPKYKSKVLTSKGIGSGYLKRRDSENNKFKGEETNEAYTTRSGIKLNLPIYYRNHIYTEEEREKLWISKLDKEERWVDGTKVDVSKGEEDYYKVLREARKKNQELGYGVRETNWEKRRYDREMKKLKKK